MPRDTNAAAHLVVAMATGEAPAEPASDKNPAAVALGRLGGHLVLDTKKYIRHSVYMGVALPL